MKLHAVAVVIADGCRDIQPKGADRGFPAHTDAAGNLFIADDFFTGGRTASQDDDVFIVGTGTNASNDSDVDDILYQTERFDADLSYEIPVANGLYDIRLHFAEIFFTSENERVFDVSIEGLDVLDNYDIFGTRMNAFTPGHDASIVEAVSYTHLTLPTICSV